LCVNKADADDERRCSNIVRRQMALLSESVG
jgi:hypothetical protein